MLGFRALLFSLCTALILAVPATADDYRRVIGLHNKIVGDAAGVGLDGLNQQINELVGGNGDGISEKPATPVQSTNMVHVLIREALDDKEQVEQAVNQFLTAYISGKVKGGLALNHLRTVLIVYIAARLERSLPEDERIQGTYKVLRTILDKPHYKHLKISLSEDAVKEELKRLEFFKFYNFFVRHPDAQKVMLDPDRLVDYKLMSSVPPVPSAPMAPPIAPSSSSGFVPPPPPPPPPGSTTAPTMGRRERAASEAAAKPVPDHIKKDFESIKSSLQGIEQLEVQKQKMVEELTVLRKELEKQKNSVKEKKPGVFIKLRLNTTKEAIESLEMQIATLRRSAGALQSSGRQKQSPVNVKAEKRIREQLQEIQSKHDAENEKLTRKTEEKTLEHRKLLDLRKAGLDTAAQDKVYTPLFEEWSKQQKAVKDLSVKLEELNDALKPYEVPQGPNPKVQEVLETASQLTGLLEAYQRIQITEERIKECEQTSQQKKMELKAFLEGCLDKKTADQTDFYERNADYQKAKILTNPKKPSSSGSSQSSLASGLNQRIQAYKASLRSAPVAAKDSDDDDDAWKE